MKRPSVLWIIGFRSGNVSKNELVSNVDETAEFVIQANVTPNKPKSRDKINATLNVSMPLPRNTTQNSELLRQLISCFRQPPTSNGAATAAMVLIFTQYQKAYEGDLFPLTGMRPFWILTGLLRFRTILRTKSWWDQRARTSMEFIQAPPVSVPYSDVEKIAALPTQGYEI